MVDIYRPIEDLEYLRFTGYRNQGDYGHAQPHCLAMSAPASLPEQPVLPRHPAPLFWAFSWMALQGFGGVLTVAQRELVERRGWYTHEGFLEDWALAQVLPGPNVCNLAVVFGGRCCGWRGRRPALSGSALVPAVFALGGAGGLSRGGAVACSGWCAARHDGGGGGPHLRRLPQAGQAAAEAPDGPLWCARVAGAALLAIAWWRVPLVACVLGLGGLAVCGQAGT